MSAGHRGGGRFLAPLVALPTRALAWFVGGLRVTLHGGLRAAHGMERITLRLLGWPGRIAAAGAVGYLGYRAWIQTGVYGDAALQLEAIGAPARTVSVLQSAEPGVLGLTAALIAVLLIGVPLWRRRQLSPSGPGPSSPPATRSSPGSRP